MRTVAIILGDNDFGLTFERLLSTLREVISWESNSLTEEQIKTIILEGIRFHYIAFQYGGTKPEYLDRTIEYLSKIRILFDADAEADILNEDHDSGAWYLNINDGIISGY